MNEPRPSIYGASIEVDDEQVALTVVTDPPSGTLRYDGHVIEDIPAGTLAAIPGLVDHVLRHLGLVDPLQITEHATSDAASRITELEQQVITEQKGREELRRHLERITSDYQDLSANLNERVRQAEQERDAAHHALLDAAIKPAEPSATANGAIPPSEPVGAPAAPSRSAEPDDADDAYMHEAAPFIPESDEPDDPNADVTGPSAFGDPDPNDDQQAELDRITGEDIYRARQVLGWTQLELARRSGVSTGASISNLERGYTHNNELKQRVVDVLREAIIPTHVEADPDAAVAPEPDPHQTGDESTEEYSTPQSATRQCKQPNCTQPSIGATMGPYAYLCAQHTEDARDEMRKIRRRSNAAQRASALPETPPHTEVAKQEDHTARLLQVASEVADTPPPEMAHCAYCNRQTTKRHAEQHALDVNREKARQADLKAQAARVSPAPKFDTRQGAAPGGTRVVNTPGAKIA